jgi:hypothetical protein
MIDPTKENDEPRDCRAVRGARFGRLTQQLASGRKPARDLRKKVSGKSKGKRRAVHVASQ